MDPTLFSYLQVPEGHISPVSSSIFAYGFAVAGPLALILIALVAAARWRIKARLELAACREGATLAPGRTSLHGVVELAAGADRAIRVEVLQRGEERREKGRWKHTWREVRREVRTRPFYLRLDSGQRVRVEPGGDLRYTDEMDGTEQITREQRMRFAELAAGERIFVYGDLEHGADPEAEGNYRSAGAGLVLRPPRRARMLVSSASPGEGFRRRARARVQTALAALVLALVINLIFSAYHARVAWGRNEQGTVDRLNIRRGSKNSKHYDVYVSVRTSRGAVQFRDELGLNGWKLLRPGSQVPTRFVERWPFASVVGWDATLGGGLVVLTVVQLLVGLVIYLGLAQDALAWHEGRKLVEGGAGRLDRPEGSE